MARFIKDKRSAIGGTPGVPIFIGTQKTEEITAQVIEYTPTDLLEVKPTEAVAIPAKEFPQSVHWINVNGLHNTETIKKIGIQFGIHPLVIEDLVNTGQRPKFEEYDSYLFMVLKMMHIEPESGNVVNEQLSIIWSNDFVLTFQERPGDVFDPVRNRIRESKGRIRKQGNDYLVYALVDSVVDSYHSIIERMGDEIENIENKIFEKFDKSILNEINYYKREMNYLRKTIRPIADAIMKLNKSESSFLCADVHLFNRDLLDLVIQGRDIIDTYRDMLSDDLDIYNSEVSNRMNEIMKILTIFSAVFIPLTFIAGIYGTNFEYLPELKYRYSYFIFWGVMVCITSLMILFFKRKKWL